MHLLGAMLMLATPVISFLITGLLLRRLPGWHRFGNGLLVAAPLTLVLFVVYNRSFNQAAVAAGRGIAGLTQRLLFVDILTWFVGHGLARLPACKLINRRSPERIDHLRRGRKNHDTH